MPILNLFRRKPHLRAGYQLYGAAVRAARDPYYYTALGVPDTLDGRFDMVGLYVFLLIDRLHAASSDGAALAQAVFDAMFNDMDLNIREMGVTDIGVGRRVKAMWEAFHGRATAYGPPVQAADQPALAAALAHNVWRGQEAGGADALAGITIRQHRHLAAQPEPALLAGQADFLAVP